MDSGEVENPSGEGRRRASRRTEELARRAEDRAA